MWLKCNDNTVAEATLEELQRESVGGYCNTSAYSLMYIAAAKVPMLMDSEEEQNQSGPGNVKGSPCAGDDRMDQETAAVPATVACHLESAYRSLPNDLAEFVKEDNIDFVVEKRRWDEEQEARAKKQKAAEEQEMQMVGKDPGAEGNGASSTSHGENNGDVMVVEEKLTYVHTHAKLSLDVTLGHIEKVDVSKGVVAALKRLIAVTREYYMKRVSAGIAEEKSEPVLESMVAYLLKNRVQEGIVDMALYEQFSLPGLDNASQNASVVRNYAVKYLEEMRVKRIVEDASLKEWHQVRQSRRSIIHPLSGFKCDVMFYFQTYHLYRVAVNCFIGAVESYKSERFDEALELFIVTFNVNDKVLSKNLTVSTE